MVQQTEGTKEEEEVDGRRRKVRGGWRVGGRVDGRRGGRGEEEGGR